MSENLNVQEIKLKFNEYKGKKVFLYGYVSECELAEKKDKTKYLKCKIGDTTGALPAKLWDEAQSLNIVDQLKEKGRKAASISVEVTVNEWNGEPDLKIEAIKVDFDKPLLDLIEKSKSNPKALFEKLKNLIDRVQHEDYKKLLEGIFNPNYPYANEEISKKMDKIRKDFYFSSAATGHHHNYLHGLIEHTVRVVETALYLAENYEEIYVIDKDLLIVGGILHDIGKIYEYNYEDGIEYSEEGPYVYHTVSGSLLVNELNKELEINMSRKELMKIWHLISSHHGDFSEHKPNQFCPEAHILSYADLADSRVNKCLREASSGSLKTMRGKGIVI